MKKFYTFLISAFTLGIASQSFGQVSLYTFSQSNGVYTPITGGSVFGTNSSDDQRFVDPAVPVGGTTTTGPGLSIGFPFNYNGINFDRIAINNNGWISLGQSSLTPSVDNSSTSAYTPLASTTTNTPALLRNRIAGMGRDLQAQAGAELRLETIGAAPNRKCVIQYTNYKRWGAAGTGDNINFQIVLNETSNIVQVIYGTLILNNITTTSSINHVGLGGTTSADFNNRQTTVPHDWNATSAGTTNAQGIQNPTSTIAVTAPISGLTLTWTAPPPCSGVPSPGLISGPSSTICSGSGGTLTLSGYTLAPGITFQWKSSAIPGGPYTAISGATNNTYAFTANATTYFICTVTCTFSGFSSNTLEFVLNVDKPLHSAVSATPSTTCSPGTSAITGTVSGGVTTGGIGVVGSSGTINLAIPDGNATGVNTTIALPASSIPNAGSLKIRINVNHTWVGDLKFTLTSPCGTTFLFDRPGVPPGAAGNSDNLGTASGTTPPPGVYTFDIAGATVIPETNTGTGFIAPGIYKPSDVNGAAHNWAGITFPCSAAGNWVLNVSDNAGIDVGTLVDWSILAPAPANYTHTLTGPGTIIQNASTGTNNSTANFSVTALPAGTHNFTLTSTDVLGCSVSSPLSVIVNQTPTVTITPAAPVICAGDILQLTAAVVPGNTQTFSSGTINLAIPDNSPTGVTTTPIVLPAGSITNAADLKVSINASHTWVGDLKFTLTSPCGTTFLFDRPGVPAGTFGNSNNLGTTNAASNPPPAVYTFDLTGATVIPETSLAAGFIPSGIYKPSDAAGAAHNWAGFTFPCSGAGNWTLTISDNGGGDIGILIDWSIIKALPTPVVFSPNTNLFTDAAATIPYTGTPVTSVYAKPPSTATYTAIGTVSGCPSAPANVTVTVNQLPAITVQPTPATQTICPGFNVTYTVTATGAGPTYQWRRNGVNLTNGGFISGATSNTLLLSTVSSANSGNYDVVVSGTCPPSVTSNTVVLNVATAPTISTHPANVTVCANANASFSVVAAGVPAPTIYQWQVSTDGVIWNNLTTEGSYTSTFTITGTTTAVSGNRYRVIVTNSCGQNITSNVATLTVNAVTAVTATDLWSRRICISDTLVPLVGTPIGGSWSGIGVSGFNFVPTATAVGTYTLTYTYLNSFGCSTSDTTKIIVSDCPERIRLLSENGVILYPNPNSGRFNIRINSTLYNYVGMKVYNVNGQLVNGKMNNDVLVSPVYSGLVFGRVIPVDLSYLPSGIYVIKVYYDDGVRTSEKGFTVSINR